MRYLTIDGFVKFFEEEQLWEILDDYVMTLTHTDYDRMFGKNLTVYGESKMIEVQRNYKLTLSEEQMRQLFNLLGRDKELLSINSGYDELRTVYNELKKIFDSGIRSTESFESAKDYNHIYAPGTK